MKRAKKRFMSVALVCVMLLGMLPMMRTTANAAGWNSVEELKSYALANWVKPLRGSVTVTDTFGSPRDDGRKHAAVDLWTGSGLTPVYAMTDGEVIKYSYNYYGGTDLLLVRSNDGSVLAYGEISSTLHVGDKVSAGQQIATLKVNNYTNTQCLHLELYFGTAGNEYVFNGGNMGNEYWYIESGNYQRRRDLLDPTFLLQITKEPDGSSSNQSTHGYVGYGYPNTYADVIDLQTMLNKVNGAGLVVDGIFGAGTQQAIKNYQARKGLTADGICGIDTWTALEADYKAANASGSSSTPKVTAPFAPTNVKATKIDNRNAKISWNAVSGATNYEVQFRRDGIDWRADTDYTGGTSYTSTYLDYDPYYFRVCAVNSAGASAWAEITYYRNGTTARPIVGQGYTTQGTAVSDLQTMLNKVIGAGLPVDGIYGNSTYNAVSTYQSRKGLTADGICGADTWAALEADYNASATANVHSHSLAHVPAKAATEQTEGNIEYWYCSSCSKYFSNANATQEISKGQTVLAKLTHKHSLTHAAAKASTEKAVGNIEYWYCAGCGKYFYDANATREISKEQTVVAQLNHTHKLVHTAKKDATCTESGNVEYWHCSDCSKYFSDAQGKSELSSQSLLTAALGHNYVNGVCSQCGEKQNNVAKGQFGDVSLAKQTLYFQGQFADVPADQWFTSGVASAFEFGLMKGNGDGFNPYGDVTLAEAITMAARINSIYTTGGESFDQSVGNAWYQTYLDYAYQNGIINRAYYSSNVNNKATRAQFAEIFAKCLPDAALPKGNNISDDAIPDVGMSDSFAQHVYKLYRAGILTGSDANGTFSPLTYITRAEAATIVSRMADSNNRVAFSIK